MIEEKKTNKVDTIGQICFWIGLLMELYIVILEKSDYVIGFEGIWFRISFVLFTIKLVTTKYSKKQWLCVFLVGCFAMLSYFLNTRDEVVRLVVLLFACKGMDKAKVLRTTFWVTLIGCIGLVLLSVTGIFGRTKMVADFGRYKIETRYMFGMGHPNALHCMFLMLVLLGFYLYQKKLTWYIYLLIGILDFVLYQFTDSNTGFLMTMVTVVMAATLQYWKQLREQKWIYVAAILLLLACTVFSALGSQYVFDWPGLYAFDNKLNGRLQSSYVYENARLVNWKLFSLPENDGFFDEAYVRLFYWYGIIPGIIYLGAIVILVLQAKKKRDIMLYVMLVVLMVYSIMEAHIISTYLLRNYLILIMGFEWVDLLRGDNPEIYVWRLFSRTLQKQ